MTLYLAPICLGCTNFIDYIEPTPEEIQAEIDERHARIARQEYIAIAPPVIRARCNAFPDGIPQAIITSERDHRKRVAGDHGIRFEPKTDRVAHYADMLLSIPNDGESDARVWE